MTCPDPAALEGLFRGSLSDEARRDVEHHVDGCDACSQLVSALTRLFGSASWGIDDDGAASSGATHDDQETNADEQPALGRYRLGRRLGAGGMGIVFEAYDPELDRRVAIKLLHPSSTEHALRTQERLLREARAMARLAHPNVVAIHDVGRLDGQVFLTMELLAGPTLREWLASSPRPHDAAIIDRFVAAGRGLAAAHSEGLVHRDFKPDNVLIGADERVRVTDFGLALAGSHPADRDDADTTDLTGSATPKSEALPLGESTTIEAAAGIVVGTPAYMSPEHWRCASTEARSDQFSFCVALYEALFERRPFAGDDIASLSASVLEGDPELPPRGAPRWLWRTLRRGLASTPERRHPTMAALLGELERERKGARRLGIVAGALTVGALCVGAAYAYGQRNAAQNTEANLDQSADATAPSADDHDHDERATIERCLARLAHGRGSWSAERREALAEHLQGMDDGENLAKRALLALDRWIEIWAASATSTCDLASDRSTPLERCVEADRLRFEGLIRQALDHNGFQIAASLSLAVDLLPSPAQCALAQMLETLPLPPPKASSAKVRFLQRDLAATRALINLEVWEEGRGAAEQALKLAEELHYAPAIAEAQLLLGLLAVGEGRSEDALRWLEAAAETADNGSSEPVLVEASLALVGEHGATWLDPKRAKRWQRIVANHADRLQDHDLASRLALAEARALRASGEHVRALARLDDLDKAAIEQTPDTPSTKVLLDLERADLHLTLADPLASLEAAKQAERLALERLGPDSLLLAETKAAQSRALLKRQELDPAAALAEAAVKIPVPGRSVRHDRLRGHYLGLRGHIAMAKDDPSEAREHYERAPTYLIVGPARALPQLWLANLDNRSGDPRTALRRLDDVERFVATMAVEDPRQLELLEEIGRLAREAGDLGRARRITQQALQIADLHLGFSPRHGALQRDLALVERAAGDDTKALELFDKAHVALAGGLGLGHPQLVAMTLARADLAWDLGNRTYAMRLYSVRADDLRVLFGAEDPRTARAYARGAEVDP